MHVHDFKLIDSLHRRYQCVDCKVYGYRKGHRAVAAFTCQLVLGTRHERKTCGKPAVHVEGQHSKARCAEHVERLASVSQG